MSKKFLNTLTITLILILSVGCGFLYDILFTQYRLREYPRQYNDTVIACYYDHAVPVSVIYGTIKMQSDYDSGLVDGDKIGLMQLTREEYDLLSSGALEWMKSLTDQRAAIGRQKTLDAIEACDGNRTAAAKLLGIARSTLYERLEKYGEL